MITIVTVHYNTYDFLKLLVESLKIFTHTPYELIVIDNSEKPQEINEQYVHQILMPINIGHGRGLNQGVAKAFELFPKNPFLMFLDSDCHIIKHHWDNAFISKMKDYDLITGRGPASKPVRPACMFMRRDVGRYDWADSQGYRGNRATPGGYDVACKAYFQIMADNLRIGFLETSKSNYETANGEEFGINGKPYVYHHWHASWSKIRQEETPEIDLEADKIKLFSKILWRLI